MPFIGGECFEMDIRKRSGQIAAAMAPSPTPVDSEIQDACGVVLAPTMIELLKEVRYDACALRDGHIDQGTCQRLHRAAAYLLWRADLGLDDSTLAQDLVLELELTIANVSSREPSVRQLEAIDRSTSVHLLAWLDERVPRLAKIAT